ncbi:uncharacterized protein [Oscarella lobularis]|uniref:uncharacterized protein n=1 Tax=Oscarella lobularis TaxID=121494 RepID=UPI0033144CF9
MICIVILKMVTLFAYCIVSILATVVSSTSLDLHLFTNEQSVAHGARCLDGSPSGYYYRAGSNKTSWAIFLQGGGFCDRESSCTSRSHGPRGSSKNWPSQTNGEGILSTDSTGNKDFYSWNHVFIPYCGGDFHTGQRTSPNEWNLFFAGHLTIETIISDLLNMTNLNQSQTILVSGESAGGIGAFEHADYFATTLHWATVKSAPIGGLFFPENVSGYSFWVKNEEQPPRNSSIYDLYRSFTEEKCTKANPDKPYWCGPANIAFLYPYIETSLYVIENQYDSNQLFVQLGCPKQNTPDAIRYIEYYGDHMRATMMNITRSPKGDGLFGPSCLDHTGNFGLPYEGVTIKNTTYGESLGDWYFNRKGLTQLMDDCPKPCNKECKTRF